MPSLRRRRSLRPPLGHQFPKLHLALDSNADYVEQTRRLEQFVDKNPDDPAARFLLGYHWGFLGHAKEAHRELVKVVELDSRDELAAKLLEHLGGKAAVTARPAPPKPRPERLEEPRAASQEKDLKRE